MDELNPEEAHSHSHEGHEHTMPDGHEGHDHEGEVVTHEMSGMIGTAILLGFAFMLIIDEATSAFTSPNTIAQKP